MFSHVLLPVDSPNFNHRALRKIADMVRKAGAKLILVYVSDPMPPGFYSSSPLSESFLSPKDHQRACEHFAHSVFSKLASVIGTDLIEARCHVMNAHVSSGILDAAKQQHADVIAMVSHKYSGLKRLVLGSHTREVMQASRLPVLVF
jgi:nucleotide-binding universal stress UspA family protein